MKLIVAFIFLIPLTSFSNDYIDAQAKQLSCNEIEENYPVDEDWRYHASEANRWKYKVQVKSAYCLKFEPVISNKKFRKVGSKKYLVGMNLKLDIKSIQCKVALRRTVRLIVSDNDTESTRISKWYLSYDPNCFRKADSIVLKTKEGSRNLKRMTDYEIKRLDLYIPDYLEMGEPDDGAGTYGWKYYKILNSSSEVVGYMTGYTYYNHEGQYATRYAFRYNHNGGFLEHKIDSEDVDFEDIY